jgi:hypothetical protein
VQSCLNDLNTLLCKSKGFLLAQWFFSCYHMACANLPSSNVDGMKIFVITFSLNPKPITFRIWCSLFILVYHLLMFLAWDDNATNICILVIKVFTWCTHQHFVVANLLSILGYAWRGNCYFYKESLRYLSYNTTTLASLIFMLFSSIFYMYKEGK